VAQHHSGFELGRFDIIFGGMSVTEARKEKVDFADPFMTVGQTVLLNAKHRKPFKSYKDLNDPNLSWYPNPERPVRKRCSV
jgi:ABC-type amino acid transport substrate-binding protein